MKRRSRLSLILVLCAAFLFSSTTVYAATVECADTYVYMEKRTSDETSDALDITNTLTEYTEYGDTGRIICVEGEVLYHSTRLTNGFEWDLPVGHRKYGPYFKGTEGMDVAVSVLIDPRYVNIRVGIEDELGYRYYVENTDSIYHIFTLQNNRRYRIYVQNNSGTDVFLAGSYVTR